MRTSRTRIVTAALVAIALAAASACGGDDDTTEPVPTTSTVAVTTTAAVTTTTAAAPPTSTPPAPLAGDPRRAEQWHIAALGLESVWTRARGDGVTIAIVDTGVDLSHPDLTPNLVPGRDIVDGDDEPQDVDGHGTHVAGIAAAATGNGVGGSGVAPNAKIMPVRVLGADGSGTEDDIAAGIRWAVEHGAQVINLSLGESGFVARLRKGGPLNAAIREAGAAGVVVVAASGNEGSTRRSYRIGVPVIVVNASDRDGKPAAFSNAGDLRAVAAPGVGILSTAPTAATTIWPSGSAGYEQLDGTSMASPVVAGLAALLLSAGIAPGDVAERMVSTVTPNDDPRLGAGIIDPTRAVP